jgi:hypothetical protein
MIKSFDNKTVIITGASAGVVTGRNSGATANTAKIRKNEKI